MTPASTHDVTQLLLAWRNGDAQALEQLTPLLYDELRRLAARYLRRERADHTLQATALAKHDYFVEPCPQRQPARSARGPGCTCRCPSRR